MNAGAELQAGGTLTADHIYIARPQDKILLDLLVKRQYVNVLAPRQMGKSSLMVRTTEQLSQRSIRFSSIDLSAELGSTETLSTYYQGLILKIASDLDLDLDVDAFWDIEPAATANQKLLRFFREVALEQVAEPIVVFLDEIDSTLRLPYTDDLFTAIRGMYNNRQLEPAYGRVTFCLLGVATPNELVKNRRTTSYNIGHSLELRDFDSKVDDLSPLCRAVSADPDVGRVLVDRVLYWTDGQPYLTVKLCDDIKRRGVVSPDGVDRHVEETFRKLDQVTGEIHFQQVLRFVNERLSDGFSTLQLYSAVLEGARERDQTTLTHAELKLSGLVKRDADGYLIVRNRIYKRLFDRAWVESARPSRTLLLYRRQATIGWTAAIAAVVILVLWLTYIVLPGLGGAWTQLQLMAQGVSVTRTASGIAVSVPSAKADNMEGIARQLAPFQPTKLIVNGASNLSFLQALGFLEELQARGKITDISPVASLTKLRTLDLSINRELQDVSPLRDLKQLSELSLSYTAVKDLAPLADLTALQFLRLAEVPATDLAPLRGLSSLESIGLQSTNVSDLSPLVGLRNLRRLDLTQANQLPPAQIGDFYAARERAGLPEVRIQR